MSLEKREILSLIPKVDEILKSSLILELLEKYPRISIVDTIRMEINNLREEILNLTEADISSYEIDYDHLTEKIVAEVEIKNQMKLRRVINATGVVLHTNLGRALISEDIVNELIDVACNYSTLEYNLKTG